MHFGKSSFQGMWHAEFSCPLPKRGCGSRGTAARLFGGLRGGMDFISKMSIVLQHRLLVKPGIYKAPVLVESCQVVGVVVLQQTQDVHVHRRVSAIPSSRLPLPMAEDGGGCQVPTAALRPKHVCD